MFMRINLSIDSAIDNNADIIDTANFDLLL